MAPKAADFSVRSSVSRTEAISGGVGGVDFLLASLVAPAVMAAVDELVSETAALFGVAAPTALLCALSAGESSVAGA